MAGILVPLFSRRRFSFTGLSTLQSMDIVIVRALPCFDHRELTFLVKVHSRTLDGGAKISLIAFDVSQSPDAPGVDFFDAAAVCTASVTTGSAPALIDESAREKFGGHVRIIVRGTRGTTGSCEAILEADLVLKE